MSGRRLKAGMCPTMTEEVVERLHGVGVKSVLDFMQKDCETLAKETLVSYKDLQSIRRVLYAHHAAFAMTGYDVLEATLRQSTVLATGSDSLDKLLGGGLMTGELIEVCGRWGTGKTTLCLQLALHSAIKKGLHTLYVDSSGSVTPMRLFPMIENLTEEEEEIEKALSRIKVVNSPDIWSFFRSLEYVDNPVTEANLELDANAGDRSRSQGKLKLLIIDSLPPLITPLLGRGQRQGLAILNEVATTLKSIAVERQLAVVLVNNVLAVYGADKATPATDEHSKWKPAFGRYWAHVPNTRLFIKRQNLEESGDDGTLNKKRSLSVSVWKSTRLKMAEAEVAWLV